jgi:RNA polymerase sigma factor (sigma-70 family)
MKKPKKRSAVRMPSPPGDGPVMLENRRRLLEFIRMNEKMLRRYVFHCTRSLDASVDVLGDLWIRYFKYEADKDLYLDDHITASVFCSARRLILDWCEKNKHQRCTFVQCAEPEALANAIHEGPTVEELADEQAVRKRVLAAVQALSEPRATIVTMLLDDKSIKEIATALGLPTSTIQLNKKSAQRSLKRLLRAGGTE